MSLLLIWYLSFLKSRTSIINIIEYKIIKIFLIKSKYHLLLRKIILSSFLQFLSFISLFIFWILKYFERTGLLLIFYVYYVLILKSLLPYFCKLRPSKCKLRVCIFPYFFLFTSEKNYLRLLYDFKYIFKSFNFFPLRP